MPPKRRKSLKLYILVTDASIGRLLAQDNESNRGQSIFYLSLNINLAEINYTTVENLCLPLFFAATKLRHYMLPLETQIIV